MTLTPTELDFDGQTSDDLGLVITGVNRNAGVTVSVTSVAVPGMDGEYEQATHKGLRTIVVTGHIDEGSEEAAQSKLEDLAAWLETDHVAEFSFTDEPGKVYYGRLEGEIEAVEDGFIGYRDISVTLVCRKPFKFAAEEDAFPVYPDQFTVTNGGSAPVEPRFVLPVLEDETYVRIEHPSGEFVQLGSVGTSADTAQDRDVQVLREDCSSLTGWAQPGVMVSSYKGTSGAVAGTMAANGSFYATGFGTGAGLHGPTVRQALSELSDDFQAVFYGTFNNVASPWAQVNNESRSLNGTTGEELTHSSVNDKPNVSFHVTSSDGKHVYSSKSDYAIYTSGGKTFIKRRGGSRITDGQTVKIDYRYLVGKCGALTAVLCDANGAEVARFSLFDLSDGAAAARFYAKVGSTVVCDVNRTQHKKVKTFDGIGACRIVVRRMAGRWTFSVSKKGASGYYSIYTVSKTLSTTDIGMVDLNVSAYSTRSVIPGLKFDDITVTHLAGAEENTVPVIAKAGDILEIDIALRKARKNGADFMEYWDPRSHTFALEHGETTLGIRLGNSGSVNFPDFGATLGTPEDGDTSVEAFDPTTEAVCYLRKRWL